MSARRVHWVDANRVEQLAFDGGYDLEAGVDRDGSEYVAVVTREGTEYRGRIGQDDAVAGATFKPGDGVVYRSHPGAAPEQGVVTEVRELGVMVRYDAMGPAKLTPTAMLTRLAPSQGVAR